MLRADAFVRRLRELLRKPKGIRSRAMRLVMLQPLAALGNRWDVAGGNPPQAVMRLVHLYETLRPVAEYLHVIRLVGVSMQPLQGLPHPHVGQDGGVIGVGD